MLPMRRLIGLGFMERLTRSSYADLFSIWLGLVAGFGLIYFLLSVFLPHHAPNFHADLTIFEQLLDGMYFSTITATTIGFGDIVPMGFSKAIAALEGVLGFGTFGIFMAKLVAHQQDATIREMHEMMKGMADRKNQRKQRKQKKQKSQRN